MNNLSSPVVTLAVVDWSDETFDLIHSLLEKIISNNQTIRKLTIGTLNPLELLQLTNCSIVETLRIVLPLDGEVSDLNIYELRQLICESTSWKSLKVVYLPELTCETMDSPEDQLGVELDRLEEASKARGITIEFDTVVVVDHNFDAKWEFLVFKA